MEKIISRRAFFLIGMQSALFAASGCASFKEDGPTLLTPMLYRHKPEYWEHFSSVMITEDRKKIVVFTKDFHYIVDCPAKISSILHSSFKEYYWAKFTEFHVSSLGSVKGTVWFGLLHDAPPEAIEEAVKLGLIKKGDDGAFTEVELALEGTRYKANGISAPTPAQDVKALNRTYAIRISADRSAKELARNTLLTPITVAVDGSLVLVGASVGASMVVALLPFAGLTMLAICSPGRGCAK
ncbi:MAG: hypothetical protein K0S46_2474 [Moraxellaceae bacterium]|jgi:hypothetical protein|nr:hypothetical protein [Moraxellaceae bacterium]